MKSYERESLLKNFLVFFSLLAGLLILLFLELYRTEIKDYKQDIYKTMQVCSYTMSCEQYIFDFAPKDNTKLNELYEHNELYAFFAIPKSEKYNIKISYPRELYKKDLKSIRKTLWIKFVLAMFILSGFSLFFTFYSLQPIRKALQLNTEFIKDILHDFNTPITAMVLNLKMFQDKHKEKDPFIEKVSHSVNTILLLQNNLKSFLHHSPTQSQEVNIGSLAKKRLSMIQHIYPKLTYDFKADNALIKVTHNELLTRILDNLLSNAAKYNRVKGKVSVHITGDTLHIKDTGKGIKNVNKSMQRYYKEQDRGIGLGLHIVQKLTDELNIKVTIESTVDVGTEFMLDFSALDE